MTVCVIIAIAAAIAVPNMTGWFGKRGIEATTRQMFTDMQRARSLAIANNRPIRILIKRPDNWYQILDTDTSSTVIVPQTNLPHGITFGQCTLPLSATFNTAGINTRGFSTLNAQGTVEILSTTATAGDHSNDMAIVIDPSGAMRIMKKNDAGWPL